MYYKLGQFFCYKLGQIYVADQWSLFIITNWGKAFYRLGQVLQVGANYYILGSECMITKENLFKNVFQGFGNILEGVFTRSAWYRTRTIKVFTLGKVPTFRNL